MMLPSVFNDRFFDDFMDFPFERRYRPARQAARFEKSLMKTDVKDLENGYELTIDLPGFKKEDIEIRLEDGYLTVTASKSDGSDRDEKSDNYIRRERWFGKCSRSFYVGKSIKPADIKAKMEDGILHLDVPKSPAEEVKDTKVYID